MAIDPKSPAPPPAPPEREDVLGGLFGSVTTRIATFLAELPVPSGVKLAEAEIPQVQPEAVLPSASLPSIAEDETDFYALLKKNPVPFYALKGYEPDYFGTLFTEGVNPDQTALLSVAALSYTHTNLWPDATEDQKTALHQQFTATNSAALQALQQHFPDLSTEELQTKLTVFQEHIQDAKTSGTPLEVALPEALSALGVTLRDGHLDEAEALRKREEEARDQMFANAKAAAEGKPAAGALPPAEPVAGTLDDQTFEKVCTAVDNTFILYKGYPEISSDQRDIIKAIYHVEITRAKGWTDPNYVIPNVATSIFEFGGATLGGTASVLGGLKDAFLNGYGSPEDWDQVLEAAKGGANAAWDVLEAKAGKEFRDRYENASTAVTARTLREIRENVGFAICNTENHTMRAHYPIPLETLQMMHAKMPKLYAKLTGTTEAPSSDTKVRYDELTSLVEAETARYANVLTNSDAGKGDQHPISIEHTPTSVSSALYHEPLKVAPSAEKHFKEKGLMVDTLADDPPPPSKEINEILMVGNKYSVPPKQARAL